MSWLKPLPQSWWRTASTRSPSPEEPFYWELRAAALQCWEAENTASALAPTPSIRPPKCCVSASPAATAQSRLGSRDSQFPKWCSQRLQTRDCPWVAHGAAFERAMLEAILIPQHGWPVVPVERHVCTMSLALAHAYPGSLEGRRQNSRPGEPKGRRQGEDHSRHVEAAQASPLARTPPRSIGWIRRSCASICISTTGRTSRSNASCISIQSCTALPASEQDTWVLDAEINDHGVLIDAPLAAAASRLAAQALADLNERMRQETDGAVDTATKNEKLKAWLASQGVKLPRKQRKGKSGLQWKASLEPDDIEKLLAGDLPQRARAFSARNQVAGRTIGGQQNRPDVADPLRRRAGARTVQDSTARPQGDGPARDFNHRT